MIKTIIGDLLNAKENLLVHQVNCQGVMGAGIAKQLKNRYPEVFTSYFDVCSRFQDKSNLLGKVQVVKVDEKRAVVNLFGQLSFGRQNKIYTDYEALKDGFTKIKSMMVENNLSLAIPYGIGCGLGGGDWNAVYELIEEIFKDQEVTIYKLAE